MLSTFRYTLRVTALSFSLLQHGILFALIFHRPPKPGRLPRALEDMGPSFIKLGQTLSTRPGLMGERLAAELAGLRDRLPPFPAHIAKRVVAEEFGAAVE